jgi:hypothetical protein
MVITSNMSSSSIRSSPLQLNSAVEVLCESFALFRGQNLLPQSARRTAAKAAKQEKIPLLKPSHVLVLTPFDIRPMHFLT